MVKCGVERGCPASINAHKQMGMEQHKKCSVTRMRVKVSADVGCCRVFFTSKHLPIHFSFLVYQWFSWMRTFVPSIPDQPIPRTDPFHSFCISPSFLVHTQYLFLFNYLFLSNHCHHILFEIYFRCTAVRHTHTHTHQPVTFTRELNHLIPKGKLFILGYLVISSQLSFKRVLGYKLIYMYILYLIPRLRFQMRRKCAPVTSYNRNGN